MTPGFPTFQANESNIKDNSVTLDIIPVSQGGQSNKPSVKESDGLSKEKEEESAPRFQDTLRASPQ